MFEIIGTNVQQGFFSVLCAARQLCNKNCCFYCYFVPCKITISRRYLSKYIKSKIVTFEVDLLKNYSTDYLFPFLNERLHIYIVEKI